MDKKDYVITLYGVIDNPQLKVNDKDNIETTWDAATHSLSLMLSQQNTGEAITLSW